MNDEVIAMRTQRDAQVTSGRQLFAFGFRHAFNDSMHSTLRHLPMIRSGIGYDIHRFADGLKLILGGVEIAHARGLEGHSDADVLSHAIADALLGAIGAGDIGQHFPNTDESIRGISSMEILKRVGNLLAREKRARDQCRCDGDRRGAQTRRRTVRRCDKTLRQQSV